MSQSEHQTIRTWAHRIGIWEGISYLLLLFVAMPLKYWYNQPDAVRMMGSAHGLLFVMFMVALFYGWNTKAFRFSSALKAFALSLIPFGTFFLTLNKSVD